MPGEANRIPDTVGHNLKRGGGVPGVHAGDGALQALDLANVAVSPKGDVQVGIRGVGVECSIAPAMV